MSPYGRVFFLTGCASGIGERLATRLAEQGAQVFACDVNEAGLAACAAKHGWPKERIVRHAFDVSDYAAWEMAIAACMERFGHIDVLMNIAGVSFNVSIHACAPAEIDRHIDINTKGVMYGCRAVAPHMVARGEGHIVNIASMAGIVPVPKMSLYCASKFAVRGFTLAIAEDLRPYGIAVTAVCPDAVNTPMLVKEALNADAEMNFMGMKLLEVDDIERIIFGQVLPKRPLQVKLPWSSGVIGVWAAAFPSMAARIIPLFRAKARRKMAEYRARVVQDEE